MPTIVHHETRIRRLIRQQPAKILTKHGVQRMDRQVLALKPGVNRGIPEEVLDFHREKLHELEAAGIVTIDEPVRMRPREAEEAARNTADLAVLEDWLREEVREQIRTAIREQISAIRNPKKAESA